MKLSSHVQEIARRFNEDEAVWRRFEEKGRGRDSGSAIPEELLDEIDWRESERECRQTCFVGLPLTPNP